MITPFVVLAALAALVAWSSWASWRARTRLLARIRAEWGQPRDLKRDMDGVADFSLAQDAGAALDDRTWNDLMLDDLFVFLDRTESSVGQQILYHRLRLAPAPRALDGFEALVARVSSDTGLRERTQITLARLRDPGGYYLHRQRHRAARSERRARVAGGPSARSRSCPRSAAAVVGSQSAPDSPAKSAACGWPRTGPPRRARRRVP